VYNEDADTTTCGCRQEFAPSIQVSSVRGDKVGAWDRSWQQAAELLR